MESLHEAAMRLTGRRGCSGGCGVINCSANMIRDDNGTCLIRRIAQCSNADEQIEWLIQWQNDNSPKPHWVEKDLGLIDTAAICSVCGADFYNYEKINQEWNFCPHCGAHMEQENRGDKIAFD